MDFVAVVDHVITLLRQRGRVTYRTLQRQFHLDDALGGREYMGETSLRQQQVETVQEEGGTWGKHRFPHAFPTN